MVFHVAIAGHQIRNVILAKFRKDNLQRFARDQNVNNESFDQPTYIFHLEEMSLPKKKSSSSSQKFFSNIPNPQMILGLPLLTNNF